jgi:uncharacterized protein YjaZ
VLKTLYLLDDKLDELEFKIVRIKNKLDENDNNIIINFKFLGKIICELQLSAQQCSKKLKNNYVFSHYLYELTRGKFDVLSECAIIISQYDPILSACQEKYYSRRKAI